MSNDLVDKGEIDLVRYGQLWERVDQANKKIDKIEEQMEELLALANKSKGGFWTGMAIASAIGGIAGFVTHVWTMR
jgi:hypothetical protein